MFCEMHTYAIADQGASGVIRAPDKRLKSRIYLQELIRRDRVPAKLDFAQF